MTPAIISALPTPFDEDGRVDEIAFVELLEALPDRVHTVLVAGTTGEFPALTDAERVLLFGLAADVVGAEQVIAHVGAAAVDQSIRLADAAATLGIDRVAMLTPYYLPADDDQVVDHFARFTAVNPSRRTFAYLFPDRTGVEVDDAVVARISALPTICGFKVSGRANALLPRLRGLVRADQTIWSGEDRRAFAINADGGDGVISGCFPVVPEPFLHPADDPHRAQRELDRVVALVGPSIERQKFALRLRTTRPWRSRMAMPALDATTRAALTELVLAQPGR